MMTKLSFVLRDVPDVLEKSKVSERSLRGAAGAVRGVEYFSLNFPHLNQKSGI